MFKCKGFALLTRSIISSILIASEENNVQRYEKYHEMEEKLKKRLSLKRCLLVKVEESNFNHLLGVKIILLSVVVSVSFSPV